MVHGVFDTVSGLTGSLSTGLSASLSAIPGLQFLAVNLQPLTDKWEALSIVEQISLIGFLIGMVFGWVAHKTRFCAMGSLYDIQAKGDWRRFRAWMLASAVAIITTQLLTHTTPLDLSKSIFLASTNINWLALFAGGVIFGIGMVLASGCGVRLLIRMGSGDLRAFVVVLIVGITGYATIRGILAYPRLWLEQNFVVNAADFGASSQALPAVVSGYFHLDSQLAFWLVMTALPGLLLLLIVASPRFLKSPRHWLSGIIVGLLVAAAWYSTGVLGNDDFDPQPVTGLSFIAPTGNMIQYLMTYSGATITFSVASVFGVIWGAFLSSLFTRRANKVAQRFNLVGFAHSRDLGRHVLGGLLMGIGAVMALGCTIGQSVSGLATLSAGSLIAAVGILIGGVLTFPFRKRFFRI